MSSAAEQAGSDSERSPLFRKPAPEHPEDDALILEGVDDQGICNICHNLQGDLDIKTTPRAFIASASHCSWCSAIFRVLQLVTDVTKPVFHQIDIYRGPFLAKGVVDVRLRQEGTWVPGTLHNKFDDPFPNSYKIYTPAGVDEAASIPGLGLRDGEDDNYQELHDKLEDRLDQAKKWLDHCIAEHPSCKATLQSWPKRVLEISGEMLYLREFPSRPVGADYIALSYCWGTEGNIRTLKSNIDSHRSGLLVFKLPKTLRDAIEICQSFEVQYLWIDALCIVQDDRNDWAQQIPLMSEIYAGAHFVIAAESSASVHNGCLELDVSKNAPYKRLEFEHAFGTEPPRRLQISVQEEPRPHHVVRGHHSSRPDPSKEFTPLSTRAWAFQERFLARRILFCTSSELSWHCSRRTWCECSKTSSPAHVPIRGDYWGLGQLSAVTSSEFIMVDDPLIKLSIWCEVVRQYSARILTNWTDRVAAMQGIVVALSQTFPDSFKEDDFMVGMWRPFMARLLAWKRNTLEKLAPETGLRGHVPSLSWMETAAIEYSSFCFQEESEPLVDILDIQFTPSKDCVFGAGLGTITLTGLLIPARGEKPDYGEDLRGLERPEFHLPDAFVDHEMLRFHPTIEFDPDDPTDDNAWETVTHFVPLIRTAGSDTDIEAMYVAPVDGQESTFRRVGYHMGHSRTARIPDDDIAAPFLRTFKLI